YQGWASSMTFRPSTETAEIKGWLGFEEREKAASQGRLFSSLQCTVTAAGVESTVIAPGFTSETSSGSVWGSAAGKRNASRSNAFPRVMINPLLKVRRHRRLDCRSSRHGNLPARRATKWNERSA